jgi:hypothetical protein
MIKNKEKIKFLKYTFLFLLYSFTIIYVIERGLAYLVSNSGDAQTGKVNLIMSHKIDPEIIIFGSSIAEVGFNSNLIEDNLKKSAYNLAIDGTRIVQSRFLIDEFIEYSKNCKVVVLALHFMDFSEIDAMTEPSRFLSHLSNNHLRDNIKQISPGSYYKFKYIPFYSFTQVKHTYYKNAIIGMKNILSNKDITDDSLKGYRPCDLPFYDTKTTNKSSIQISKKNIAIIVEILNKIKNKGIKPILIILPVYINGQSQFSNYADFINTAIDVAANTNARLINFSKSEFVYSKEYFYNNGHLNRFGSSTISKNICDSLKSIIYD